MKKFGSILTRLVMVLAVGVPAVALTATPAHASACLDGAVDASFTSTSGTVTRPSTSTVYTASSRCRDVNWTVYSVGDDGIFLHKVRVCFLPSGGGYNCNSWKNSTGPDWILIATDVLDGTKFRVEIQTPNAVDRGYQYGVAIAF